MVQAEVSSMLSSYIIPQVRQIKKGVKGVIYVKFKLNCVEPETRDRRKLK